MSLNRPTKLPLSDTDPYPLGKQLFYATMAARGYEQDRTEYDWNHWEADGGFMPKHLWEKSAKLLLKAHGINV